MNDTPVRLLNLFYILQVSESNTQNTLSSGWSLSVIGQNYGSVYITMG